MTHPSASYLQSLLRQAAVTARDHPDEATRSRADARIERLAGALTGVVVGTVVVGSRTPVDGVPAWATLEVVTGGFATGELLAGGPIRDHERTLALEVGLGVVDDANLRRRLNGHFLTDEGLGQLRGFLDDGRYRFEVPEEGALLVVAWLTSQEERTSSPGDRADARTAIVDVLDAITPFFDRLRFYPIRTPTPVVERSVVHLRTVRETASALQATDTPLSIRRQQETLQVWIPFEDELVRLFLDSAVDDVLLRAVDDVWRERARALWRRYDVLRGAHTLCRRHRSPRENLARLVAGLQAVVAPSAFKGSATIDLATIDPVVFARLRRALADIVRKRGAPGSASHLALRQTQADIAALPTRRDLADVLVERLRPLPDHDGVDDVDALLTPLDHSEAARVGAKNGAALLPSLAAKVRRAKAAPIEDLIDDGIIGSGEVLATVASQVTARVRSAALPDATLRRLYAGLYAAFRRRRSLLLLNLEHQVRFEELPWVEAIERERAHSKVDSVVASTATLQQLAAVSLRHFPDVIVPNKLLQEFVALAKDARLPAPFVEEIAADIFEGAFSPKFGAAAALSAQVAGDGLYARYYGIDVEASLACAPVATSSRGRVTTRSGGFGQLCFERAGAKSGRQFSVAANGQVVEQAQILTTHNLAVLFDVVGVRGQLAPAALARVCLQAIVNAEPSGADRHFKLKLRRVKNQAYAWRQALFFLDAAQRAAGDDVDVVGAFLGDAEAYVAAALADGSLRSARARPFRRLLEGLRAVHEGEGFNADGVLISPGRDGRRLLGWTTGPHWFLEDQGDLEAAR